MTEQQTPTQSFSRDQFADQLADLTTAWEGTWNAYETQGGTQTPGPFHVLNPSRLSAEQLAAEQPEMDAYNTLVNQAATGIADATSFGQETEAVDCVLKLIDTHMGPGSQVPDSDKQRLLGNIFKKTLAQLVGSDASASEAR